MNSCYAPEGLLYMCHCVLACRNVCGKKFFPVLQLPAVRKALSLTAVSRQHSNSYDSHDWNFLLNLEASAGFSALDCTLSVTLDWLVLFAWLCSRMLKKTSTVFLLCMKVSMFAFTALRGRKSFASFKTAALALLCAGKHRREQVGTALVLSQWVTVAAKVLSCVYSSWKNASFGSSSGDLT